MEKLLHIKIKILNENNLYRTIKIIRKYYFIPFIKLKNDIKSNMYFIDKIYDRDNFYKGLDKIIEMIKAINLKETKIEILLNEKEVEITELLIIINKFKELKKTDLY